MNKVLSILMFFASSFLLADTGAWQLHVVKDEMTDEITGRYLLLVSNPLDSAAKSLGIAHFCGQDSVLLYSFDDTILPYKIASQTTRTKVDDNDIVNIEWQQVVASPRSAISNIEPETLLFGDRLLIEVTLYMIYSDEPDQTEDVYTFQTKHWAVARGVHCES